MKIYNSIPLFKNIFIKEIFKYKTFIFALLFITSNAFSAMTLNTLCVTLIESIISPIKTVKNISEISSYKKKLIKLKKENQLAGYFTLSRNGYDFSRRARLGLLVNLDYEIVFEYYKKSISYIIPDTLPYEDIYLFNFDKRTRIEFFKLLLKDVRDKSIQNDSIVYSVNGRETGILDFKTFYSHFEKMEKHNKETLSWIKNSKNNSDLIKYMVFNNSELFKNFDSIYYSQEILASSKKQMKDLNKYVLKEKGIGLFEYMLENNSKEIRVYDIIALVELLEINDIKKIYFEFFVMKHLSDMFGDDLYLGDASSMYHMGKYKGDDLQEIMSEALDSYQPMHNEIHFNNIKAFLDAYEYIPKAKEYLLKNLEYGYSYRRLGMEDDLKGNIDIDIIIKVLGESFSAMKPSKFYKMFKYFIKNGHFSDINNFNKLLRTINKNIIINKKFDLGSLISSFIYAISNSEKIGDNSSIDTIFDSLEKHLKVHYKDMKLHKSQFINSLNHYYIGEYKSSPFIDYEKTFSKYVDFGLIDERSKVKLLKAALTESVEILNPYIVNNGVVGYKELHQILKKLSSFYPEIINGNEYKHLLTITNTKTLFDILKILMNEKITYQENKLKYFLSLIGISYEGKDLKNGTSFINKIVPLVIDMNGHQNISELVKRIGSSNFYSEKGRKKILHYLELYRNYIFISNDRYRSDNLLLSVKSKNIGEESIDEYIEHASNILYKKMNSFFSEEMDVDPVKLKVLSNRWGDLSAIYTLLGRYSAKPRWSEELEEMKEIFNNVLNDNFINYKYFGGKSSSEISKAEEQLSPIKQENIKYWVNNYNDITFTNEKLVSQDTNIVKEVITSNLIPHINDLIDSSKNSLKIKDVVDRVKAYKGNPTLLTNYLAIELDYRNNTLLRNDLLKAFTLLLEMNDSNTKKYISHLKILSKMKELKISKEVQLDITYLLKLINSKPEKNKNAIIFGTTIDHPKLLLETGCLVKAASCQDYRTGTYIDILPAYVIDANTKLLLSFELKSGNFENIDEYKLIQKMIKSEVNIVSEFIPEKFMIKFNIEGKEFFAKDLRAISRNVIRLGSSGGRPVVFTEKDYRASLDYTNELQYIKKSIIDRITEKIEGVTVAPGMNITFEGSRNALGTYSDAGKGIEKGPFMIEVGK